MAFTSSQATKIRHYLGYPQLWRYINPRLESAIEVVGGDVDAVAIVVDILTSIEKVLDVIDSTALMSAGLKSLDKGDVELYDNNSQTTGMNAIGRTRVARLSILFGVSIANDIFKGTGYKGDGWAAGNGVSELAGLY